MSLQDLVREAGILHAHLVDDAFDKVPGAELRPESLQTFVSSLNTQQFDELAAVLGMPEGNEDEILQFLNTYDGSISLYSHRAKFGEAADLLFEDFIAGLEPEKNRLAPLIDFLQGLGIECHTFGRDYQVDSTPEPQMLFVDLKLNEREIRLDEPVRVVKTLKERYQGAHPLIFLMSSAPVALQADQEDFRDKCCLLITQFEILPKRTFASSDDLGLFLKHHIGVYSQLCQLQAHVASWEHALDSAKEKLKRTLYSLDLPDYFVLHRNTVALEQIPLGTYVSDLLLEYVSHEIESSPEVWSFARYLDDWKLSDLTRSRFNVAPVVGDIFSANVLHAFPRIAAESDRGRGPANGYLNLGDIFFRREEIEQSKIKTAWVVLSPACDLVRPSVLQKRKASILLCEGEVESLKASTIPKEVDGLHPVILRHPPENGQQFIIWWQKKRPQIWRPEDLMGLENPAESQWTHVGRLRPLYALQLQHAVTSDLSRIGVQRPPDAYVPHGIEVLIAKANKWEMLVNTFRDDPTAGAISQNKGAQKLTFILSDVVVRETLSKLRNWVARNPEEPAADLLGRLPRCDGADRALMFHVHEIRDKDLAKGDDSKASEAIFPLHAIRLPEGESQDIKESIVFAWQGREVDKHYGGGKQRLETAQGVLVFRYVRINN